jgi:hypothetical protein
MKLWLFFDSHLDMAHYAEALELSAILNSELKKLDDKMMLLEIHLLDSKAYYALKNYPKARASLTTARTFANAIYVPPSLQAAIDMQSGMLHCQDLDFKTGYLHFFYFSLTVIHAFLQLDIRTFMRPLKVLVAWLSHWLAQH